MKVTARCTRHDGWWAIEVPEVDGAYTQARRLDQAPAMVAEAVSLLTGAKASSIEVDVEPLLDDGIRAHIAAADRLRHEALVAQDQASTEVRAAARALRALGLPLRDVGTALGVSYQRAHQLTQTDVG